MNDVDPRQHRDKDDEIRRLRRVIVILSIVATIDLVLFGLLLVASLMGWS